MAKVNITYTDQDGSAPKTSWHGVAFVTGKPVELDDENPAHKALIEAAETNPWFEVEKGAAEKVTNTPYDKGAKAAEEKKDRSVPVAYRGKPDGDHWLAGYDTRSRELGLTLPNATQGSAAPLSPGGAANALTPPKA